ncbi:hypothetical protein ACFPOE_16110 [Caenimonas terrae]|uniref:Uncharacterized protein n=1 Tax=Caenimonas terrae TaxID=696074 RepID=A0ABW0NIV1_9BURK
MISREAADAIARVLLEQARGESERRKNAMARHAQLFYRFPELRQFQPWQRNVITRRCSDLVKREPLMLTLYIAWLSFVLAIAFFHPSPLLGDSAGTTVVLGGIVLTVFQRWRVRRYVRAFVAFVQSREAGSADHRGQPAKKAP